LNARGSVRWRTDPGAPGSRSSALIHTREIAMNLHLSIGPLLSLVAGVLILMVPRLLNYIVAIYLILAGLIGLFGTGNMHFN
jgi:hypothetical protein